LHNILIFIIFAKEICYMSHQLIIVIVPWLLLILEGLSEGLYDKDFKSLSKKFQALLIISCFIFLPQLSWWKEMSLFFVVYLSYRIPVINLTYNNVREFNWYFLGTTSITDRIVKVISRRIPLWFIYTFLFMVGILVTALGFYYKFV